MINAMHILWINYIIINIVTLAQGQTYKEMNDLLQYMFNATKYNKYLRPLENQTNVIKVNFTQYLTSVEHFDLLTGKVFVTGNFEISWKDEFLTWDPYLYGGKEIIQLPKEQFWKPQFELMNGRANEESSIYSKVPLLAWVTYKGNVLVISGGTYETRCNVDTMFYPFDIHQCKFQYVVTNHGTDELMVHLPTENFESVDIKENGEWKVENTNAEVILLREKSIEKIPVEMVVVSFSLRRRPTFSIINTYVPLALITSLNIATSFVRPDSGERLSFAVTLYLSLVFTTTAAIEKIPNNSLKMPYMSYGILIANIINTIGVTWSIFTVHLVNCKEIDKNKIPNFILKNNYKRRKTDFLIDEVERNADTESIAKTLKENDSHANEEISQRKIKTAKHEISGHEVAEVVDLVYFWLVLASISILNVLYFTIILVQLAQS